MHHPRPERRRRRQKQQQQQRRRRRNHPYISSLQIVMMATIISMGEALVTNDRWVMLTGSTTRAQSLFTSSSSIMMTRTRRSCVPLLSKADDTTDGISENDNDDDDEYSDLSPSMRKRIRLAKAQAEIDKILNHPVDPPFDFEKLMEKVVSISHPEATITTTATSTTKPTESSVHDQEQDQKLKHGQIVDVDDADASNDVDKNIDDGSLLHGSEEQIVVQALSDDSSDGSGKCNNNVDLDEQVSQMEADLYCAVKAQDFGTAAQKQSELSQLHIDDCGLVLQANSAFYKAFSDKDVREMEHIWLKDRACVCIHPSFKVLTGIRSIMLAWKKMFESTSGSFQRTWIEPDKIHLTVRATSAVVTCEELVYAKRFVRGKKREVELVNKLTATNLFRKVGGRWYMTHHHSSWHADSQAARVGLKRKSKPGRGKSSTRKRGGSLQDGLEDDEFTGFEGILGTSDFGPVLGDDEADRRDSDSPNVVLGSLGDLLGNWKSRSSSSGDANNMNDDAIIHFEEIHLDDNDMVGDEDEEEDDDDNDNDSMRSWKKMRKYRSRSESVGFPLTSRPSHRGASSSSGRSTNTDQATQQACIQALRKLANQGRISQKQKRVLMTDMISCSSRAECSMIVTAYKLLCSSPSFDEDSEEDFADQCLVLADSLLSSDTI